MGRRVAAAAAASRSSISGILLALAGLVVAAGASEQHLRSPNATHVQGANWKDGGQTGTLHGEVPRKGQPGLSRSGGWRERNSSTAADLQAAGVKESQLNPPAGPPGDRGAVDPVSSLPVGTGRAASARYFSGESEGEKNESSALCLGCLSGMERESAQPHKKPLLNEHNNNAEGPGEAVSGLAQPLQGQQESMWILLDQKEVLGSSAPNPESQEDAGSGDQPTKASPDHGELAEWSTAPSTREFSAERGSPGGEGLSYDSAETDLLLREDTLGVAVPPSPTLSSPVQTLNQAGRIPEQEEPLELWLDSSSSSPIEGSPGRTDLTWVSTEASRLAVTSPVEVAQTPKPSSDLSASEIIDIDYYDLFYRESLGGAGPDSTKRRPSDDKGVSWSLHDLYDDFTPFDESDFYPTTSFYTDGDEEDLEEAEEEEDEDEEDGGGGLARGPKKESSYQLPTRATPKSHTVAQEAEPTGRRFMLPPLQTFIPSGVATPRTRPAEMGRDLSLSAENSTECRTGYIRHNNSCKSMCDTFPSYCHNGGQCYLVENLGAFCRCNTQDYIWHKGIRCESIITDFQVMCVAVGSAALVLLLLFMMTVFFAKKLYLLKTENNKLRKTKFRTPSELHNDNFSLSTIAEGSHPNDDPNALLKLQDPLKSCLKEEESFNIQNSLSPKLENSKGDPDDTEVNCLRNNLT